MDNTNIRVPEWLDSPSSLSPPDSSPSIESLPSPAEWDRLDAPPIDDPTPPAPNPDLLTQKAVAKLKAELALKEREILFENVIERLEAGDGLTRILEEHPYEVSRANFIAWTMRDPERKRRYDKAMEIWAEAMMHHQADLASGLNSMNEVARDKLIIDTNWRIMETVNRKRFAKDQQPINPFGAGGITVNIGAVDSPYAKSDDNVVDITPSQSTPVIEDIPVLGSDL